MNSGYSGEMFPASEAPQGPLNSGEVFADPQAVVDDWETFRPDVSQAPMEGEDDTLAVSDPNRVDHIRKVARYTALGLGIAASAAFETYAWGHDGLLTDIAFSAEDILLTAFLVYDYKTQATRRFVRRMVGRNDRDQKQNKGVR